MRDAATSGRTVLFVSHNMSAIAQLTSRTLLLDDGHIVFDGPTPAATQHYVGAKKTEVISGRRPVEEIKMNRHYTMGDSVLIREIGLSKGQSHEICNGGSVCLELVLDAKVAQEGLRVSYGINGSAGQPLITGLTPIFSLAPGRHSFELMIDDIDIAPGDYDFTVCVGLGELPDSKLELDALIGFGQLEISTLLSDGRMFGTWHSQWGPVVHRAVRWRPLETDTHKNAGTRFAAADSQ
jgi:hypothetical protein